MNGLYRPGDSLIHGLPAGVKLLCLVLFTTAFLTWASPAAVGVAATAAAAGYLAAGFGIRVLAQQIWPLRWFVLVIALFQLWVTGWRGAVVMAGGLVVCVTAANLVTLTTRVLDLLETLVRVMQPLRRLVDAERVALLLALTIRSVPLLSGIVSEAREARAARGQEREWRTLLSAVVIRSLHHADQLADALAARGMDD